MWWFHGSIPLAVGVIGVGMMGTGVMLNLLGILAVAHWPLADRYNRAMRLLARSGLFVLAVVLLALAYVCLSLFHALRLSIGASRLVGASIGGVPGLPIPSAPAIWYSKSQEDPMPQPAPREDLPQAIAELIAQRPEVEGHLREIVAWEENWPTSEPPYSYTPPGWETADVHTPPFVVNLLLYRGIVDQVSRSNSHRFCRLASLDLTREALGMLHVVRPTTTPDLSALFSLVIGHDDVKQVLLAALDSSAPVHVLLVGPPGTAKTLMLSDIGSLPGAEFYTGSTTTKAGLVGLLLSKKPQYLVIDELDKMEPTDLSPLLNLMEGGVVTVLQHQRQERETLPTRVFAGANDLARVPRPILSRFTRIAVPGYTPKEFLEVSIGLLTRREGLTVEEARNIAAELVTRTTDIRDAVKVARLCKGKPLTVRPIVATLFPTTRTGSRPGG